MWPSLNRANVLYGHTDSDLRGNWIWIRFTCSQQPLTQLSMLPRRLRNSWWRHEGNDAQLFIVKLVSADGDDAVIILHSGHSVVFYSTLLSLICNYSFVCLFGWLEKVTFKCKQPRDTQCTFAQAPTSGEGSELRGWCHGFGECGFCSFRGMPICTKMCACVCMCAFYFDLFILWL